MELSNFLAELLGISIVIISLSLLLKEKHLKNIFSAFEDDTKIFCWGAISVVIGVAMVISHNIWVKNWQVVITILGWISLVRGLFLLFLPELVKKGANKIKNAQWLPIALIVFLFIGLALTYLGFTA